MPDQEISNLKAVYEFYVDHCRKLENLWLNHNNYRLDEHTAEELFEKYRDEERVITLDALSRTKGWELFSYEDLGKYYTSKGNLSFAAGYWNQILEVNPFYEEALYGMIEIQTLNGKWFSVLDYAKSLSVAAKKNREFHYFYIKANFELGRYAEALKWVESASAKEKTQISFLGLSFMLIIGTCRFRTSSIISLEFFLNLTRRFFSLTSIFME